ncbi:unnamed protein product [Acidithrix sp. C25]|nr:unnamed protein product [Acidithrix sp. C25]
MKDLGQSYLITMGVRSKNQPPSESRRKGFRKHRLINLLAIKLDVDV